MKTKIIIIHQNESLDDTIEEMQSHGFIFQKAERQDLKFKVTFMIPSKSVRFSALAHAIMRIDKKIKEYEQDISRVRKHRYNKDTIKQIQRIINGLQKGKKFYEKEANKLAKTMDGYP